MLFFFVLIMLALDIAVVTASLFFGKILIAQLAMILIHIFLSLMAVFGLKLIIKQYYFTSKNYFYIFLMLFSIFVPILGMIFAIVISSILLLNHKKLNKYPTQNLDIKIELDIERTEFGVGGAIARLSQFQLPVKDRVEALLKISSIHQSKSNKYVQALLSDDEDELRLLAFEILEQQQKKINIEIASALRKISKETDPLVSANLHKKIAFWYWELIYQNLIDKSFYDFCLSEALHNAEKAVEILIEDPELWVLLGKIYVKSKFDEKANMAYKNAVTFGAPALHVVPYYAEKLFLKRDFTTVKKLLTQIISAKDIPTIGPVIRFWTNHE